MSVIVRCPNSACGASASVAHSIGGRPIRCKRCGSEFVAFPQPVVQKLEAPRKTVPSASKLFESLPAYFGRYRILKLLGRGGMGEVYLAEDSQLGREVALKIPFLDTAGHDSLVERFVQEAQFSARLHHPNICTVYDSGIIDGKPFITMAYIVGTSLDRMIDSQAPMPEIQAAELTRKVALGLSHAHHKGIVHRDLKPANILVTAEHEPIIMDFGLATRHIKIDAPVSRLTLDGGLVGTPSYMSPEQVRGVPHDVSASTDIYSLGVILFEMLTGKPPYSGSMGEVLGRILSAPAPPVSEYRPDIDPELAAICLRAMAKSPKERFASMTEFADALKLFQQDNSAQITTRPDSGSVTRNSIVSTQKVLSRSKSRISLAFFLVVAATGLTAALGILWSSGAFRTPQIIAKPVPDSNRSAVETRSIPPALPEKPKPVTFAPIDSEWAGVGVVKSAQGENRVLGAWKFTERDGERFQAIWRTGGFKAIYKGTIGENGQIVLEAKRQLEPEDKDLESIKGKGEISQRRMFLVIENANTGLIANVDFKLVPDGGESFPFQGRWRCFHRPNGWKGTRTITNNQHFTDSPAGRGNWTRDGALIILFFPNGREWLVIDPDNPNELQCTNGIQSGTWIRD